MKCKLIVPRRGLRIKDQVSAQRLCVHALFGAAIGLIRRKSTMTTVNLNLTEELQEFVNNQVEFGQFNGASGYIEARHRTRELNELET